MPLHTIVSVRFIRIERDLEENSQRSETDWKLPVRFIRIELGLAENSQSELNPNGAGSAYGRRTQLARETARE